MLTPVALNALTATLPFRRSAVHTVRPVVTILVKDYVVATLRTFALPAIEFILIRHHTSSKLNWQVLPALHLADRHLADSQTRVRWCNIQLCHSITELFVHTPITLATHTVLLSRSEGATLSAIAFTLRSKRRALCARQVVERRVPSFISSMFLHESYFCIAPFVASTGAHA